MSSHQIGTREQWLAARGELLAKEKELTRRSDQLAAERRSLPWVPVDKQYRFDTDDGPASLADLFNGHSQLFLYHFMLLRNTSLRTGRSYGTVALVRRARHCNAGQAGSSFSRRCQVTTGKASGGRDMPGPASPHGNAQSSKASGVMVTFDGVVYYNASSLFDASATGNGLPHAIDAVSGRPRWTYRVSAPVSGLAGSDGILYAADANGSFCAWQA